VQTITSPVKRCGKTTLLSVLSYLCPRVVPASNIRPAALFRVIERERPTLLIDEAELFLSEDGELRGIVNAGHRRDLAYVVRCEDRNHDFVPRKFSVWSPKVLAQIGKPSSTIEDRSILIRLQRKRPDESADRLDAAAAEQLKIVARKLMTAITPEIKAGMYTACPEIPTLLNDRAADNWRPLLALADLAGGGWPAEARNAAVVLSVVEDADAETLGVLAIADGLTVFGERERMPPTEMTDALAALPDRPWSRFSRGSPITPRKLASLLAPYGITTRRTKEERYYQLTDFEAAFSRYSGTPPETKRHCVITERKPLPDKDLRDDATKKESVIQNRCVISQTLAPQGLTPKDDAMTQENGERERFVL
jgi:putative DNA primase/helicase